LTTFQDGFSTAAPEGGWRRWSVLAAPLLVLAAAVAVTLFLFAKGGTGFAIEKTQHYLLVVNTGSGESPLQTGDRITHIGGLPYPAVLGCLLTGAKPVAHPHQITLQRDDQSMTLTVPFISLAPIPLVAATGPYLLFILLSLIMCVSVLRWTPSGQPAGLFVLTLCSFALLFVSQLPLQVGILEPAVISAAALTTTMTNWLGFSAWLHFALRFPAERQLWVGRPGLIVALVYLAPPVVAVGLSAGMAGMDVELFGWLQRLRRWAVPLILIAIAIKLWSDYRAVSDIQSKNQIRMIVAGVAMGTGVYLLAYLIPNMIVDKPLVPFAFVALATALIPLALFLAMIRYRLLDVDLMISWTVSHLLLAAVLVLAYGALLHGLKTLLGAESAANENVVILFILTAAFFFAPIRTCLAHAIDVLFFRQKIDYRQVLRAFSDSIAGAIKIADLTQLIVGRLPDVFNLDKAALRIRTQEGWRTYPHDAPGLGRHLTLAAVPRRLEENRPFLLCAQGYASPAMAEEMACLRREGYHLVLRLQSRTAFMGMLLLGKKRNGAHFTGRDIEVLATLANQVATSIENALNFDSLERSRAALQKMFTKVVHAEKMAAIGEMAAVLAHELRNPLGVIRSSAQYMAAAGPQDDNQEELLGFILAEVDRLNTVVEQTLKMARFAPPEFKPVPMDPFLQKLIDRWRQSKDHNPGVQIVYHCLKPVTLPADQSQLVQVVLNLIRNSEEAMPEGGRLEIVLAADAQTQDAILRFQDTGPGVAAEAEALLWKRFYTTKENGIGLGLPVCKQIVEAHGGTIGMQNGSEGGLTVTIHLPRRHAEHGQLPTVNPGLRPDVPAH
jgi:signal transduction histidine kinase